MWKRLSGNVNIRMRGQELPRFGSCCETINGKVFLRSQTCLARCNHLYSKKGVAMSI